MKPGGFTRNRKLTFNKLVLFLMKPLTKSVQRELDDFYQKLQGNDFSIREVSKGAFTQARAKLDPRLFIDLSKQITDSFYKDSPRHTFDGLRLLAVDGSTAIMPKHQSTIEYFGTHLFGPKAEKEQCMARISTLYDVLNCLTIDTQIQGYSTSEAELCKLHSEHIKKDDLVIFDRYYASFQSMHELLEKEAHFVFRMKENFNAVKAFLNEEENSKIAEFEYKGYSFKVRLVKIDIGEENKQILCTSLLEDKYTIEDFKEIYQSRWGIETDYNTLKNWLELENFSGETLAAVEQDLYAKVFIKNLCSALSFPIDEKIKKEKKGYAINKSFALTQSTALIIPFFEKNKVDNALKAFDEIVAKTIEMVRKNRRFERKKGPKKKFPRNNKGI